MFSANTSQVAANAANYIEDVFSTWLYTGNGSTQTITNGIDLAGKGGLVWLKSRSGADSHELTNTIQGISNSLRSNSTNGASATDLTGFTSSGFTLGYVTGNTNASGATEVSWTFREQPKFFDVVTWTGDGIANRLIPHSLTSTPGFIVVKRTDTTSDWKVHDASTGFQFCLNRTDAANSFSSLSGGYPGLGTSTTFRLFDQSGSLSAVNASGGTYVAYLFASNAGGFGLTGTDNVITCGNFTTDASGNASVNLGFEPQFWLYKPTIAARYWTIYDTMRGWSQTQIRNLNPNVSDAEGGGSATLFYPTATGFDCVGSALDPNTQHIYIAIRRGPMKVPTDGTKVFSPFTTAASTGTAVTTNFPVDFQLYKYRAGIDYWFDVDRLRGVNSTTTANSKPWLDTTSTAAEATATNVSRNWGNTGFEVPGIVGGASNVFYSFQRAPGFFDEVCYTGTGTDGTVVTHNLTVAPELIIIKGRTNTNYWVVGHSFASTTYGYALLNDTGGGTLNSSYSGGAYFTGQPTTTTMTLASQPRVNGSAVTYVAYLFATCAGVSKVGSYTGNGSTQTINCGFTGGARFVLIKRTDSTGDWYVYDTARGMTTLTDPYLLLNSTAAESATLGSVTTVATGFALNATILAAINASGGTYIFLAIA